MDSGSQENPVQAEESKQEEQVEEENESVQHDQQEDEQEGFFRENWLPIALGILSLIFFWWILPWIATTEGSAERYNFGQRTGPIGDTIGGISAPFIGLITAFLLYYSFREQVRANKLQRKALSDQQKQLSAERSHRTELVEFETLASFYDELNDNLDKIAYEGIYKDKAIKFGMDALKQFADDLYDADTGDEWSKGLKFPYEMARRVEWSLVSLRMLIEEVCASKLGVFRKRILLERIKLMFLLKLHSHLRNSIHRITNLDSKNFSEKEYDRILLLLKIEKNDDFRFK